MSLELMGLKLGDLKPMGLEPIDRSELGRNNVGPGRTAHNPLRPVWHDRNPPRRAPGTGRGRRQQGQQWQRWQRSSCGLRAILFCWLFSAVFAVYAKPPATESPVRILLFGDSLFAGYGFDDESDSFRGQLGEALVRAGFAVQLLPGAVSGDTTRGGRSRIDWTLAEPPDAAIVALGANDMLRGLPPEAMQENLDAILEAFAAAKVPVLLCGLPALSNFGGDMQTRYAAVFPHLAATHGVSLHPNLLEGVAGVPEWNQADGIHPNQLGVAHMVEQIMPAVIALIEAVRAAETAASEPTPGAATNASPDKT